jgi:methyl-accepting chemotaxis protein
MPVFKATREIARSVQQDSAAATDISANVAGASQAADQSRALAGNVTVASGELGQHADAERRYASHRSARRVGRGEIDAFRHSGTKQEGVD